MIPGRYEYPDVPANQFIVTIRRRDKTVFSQVLSPLRPKGSEETKFFWPADGSYHTATAASVKMNIYEKEKRD